MSEIELGKWYKHQYSPAYGMVNKIYKHSVHVIFDNGFESTFRKETFWNNFLSTPKSEKMNKICQDTMR